MTRASENRWTIAVHQPARTPPIVARLLRRVLRTALAGCKVSAARLSIALVSDRRIARLHQTYQQIAGPTDVLTFDLRDTELENHWPIDGEIVISLDTARREARQRGHSLADEVALYAVHGLLHLLGERDDTPARAKRMHRREDELLQSSGLKPVFARNGH
ncbi:MAG: Endoribonuclease YbeY [Phycisphaerae bacterium]|nr:Endoribonuclease YbeY [Phycisphaerae bacterium]